MTEDEHDKLGKLHDYFFGRPHEKARTRAEELDEILAATRAGKLGARSLLWLLGFIAAAGAAWAAIRGGFGPMGK